MEVRKEAKTKLKELTAQFQLEDDFEGLGFSDEEDDSEVDDE